MAEARAWSVLRPRTAKLDGECIGGPPPTRDGPRCRRNAAALVRPVGGVHFLRSTIRLRRPPERGEEVRNQ